MRKRKETMNLIDYLRELLMERKEMDLTVYNEKFEEIDKVAVEYFKELHIKAERLLKKADLLCYEPNEMMLYQMACSRLWVLSRNQDYADCLATAMKFIRITSIFSGFSDELSEKRRNDLISAVQASKQLCVYAVLKCFKDKGLEISWNGREFVFSENLEDGHKELINLACQIMNFGYDLKSDLKRNRRSNCFYVCDELRFSHLMERRSTHAVYFE